MDVRQTKKTESLNIGLKIQSFDQRTVHHLRLVRQQRRPDNKATALKMLRYFQVRTTVQINQQEKWHNSVYSALITSVIP